MGDTFNLPGIVVAGVTAHVAEIAQTHGNFGQHRRPYRPGNREGKQRGRRQLPSGEPNYEPRETRSTH